MSDQINKDYIGVVTESEDNKSLVYSRIPIDNSYKELIGKLQDMAKNDNQSVLDMQGHFTRTFRKGTCPGGFNYCYPYNYYSSYISGAAYPEILSFDEYHKELEKERRSTREAETSGYCTNPHQPLTVEQEASILKVVNYRIATVSKYYKTRFLFNCERYIQAFCFNKTLLSLKHNRKNKMFSSETIGWTTYNYTINDDIDFIVKSNFGYGGSAYFFVNLKYKGIDILPYSDTVKYYYANMVDFIRYTRLYDVIRDNWNIALNFVVETANEASYNEETFIKKWINNEIDEMMSGLERIANTPETFHNKFIKQNSQVGGLRYVRNISNNEIETYKTYPDEMIAAYQAEKISGALLLLEKLKALTSIYPKVTDSIERIKVINLEMLPHFQNIIADIERKIDDYQKIVDIESAKKEMIVINCKSHFDAIQTIIKERQEKKIYTSEDSVRKEYFQIHKDFELQYIKIQDLLVSIQEKKSSISYRNSFVNKLTGCVNQIKDYFKEVA